MKPYQYYKDSGLAWLGKVPEHWVLNKAKYIFNKMERPTREEDGVITAFRDGVVTLRTNRRTEGFTLSLKEIGYQGIRKGDLVIHEMDGFAGAIGVSDSDGKSTPVYTVCTPKIEASTKYYAYLLRMMAHNGFIQSLAKGIRERSSSFSFNIFQELELPYFPLAEQQAIADFLDCKTAQIDTLIEKKQRQIDLLQEQRTALINQAITKGMNPKAPMKDSGVDWLGQIPKHWILSRIKWVCSSVRDGTHAPPPRVDGVHRLLSARNIINDQFVIRDDDRTMSPEDFEILQKSYTVQEGDVIIAIVGATTGKSAIAGKLENVTVQRSLAILRPSGKVTSSFLNFWIKTAFVQNTIQKTMTQYAAQPGIYLDDLSELKVLVPSVEEQITIVDYLDETIKQIEESMERFSKEIELLQEYRTVLISEAVTGKIDVREWRTIHE